MDFEYTDDQKELCRALREFAEKEIVPYASEWDEKERFPAEVIRKLGELGFLGVIFPEDYGGAGMSYAEYAIVIEELARADASVGITVSAHISLCSNHIYEQGTEEQKQRFLKPLASGKWIGGWSLTEPNAGSDAGGTETTAVLKGDEWVINGSKTFTTNGTVCDVAVAMAVTDRGKAKHGISRSSSAPRFRPERRRGSRPPGFRYFR
jgi:alkylation response protein AidB-like acyl-CoA dehydrogenase